MMRRKFLRPVKKESVSPREFLKMAESPTERASISRVHFEPPKIGSGSFGKLVVEYDWAKLRRA